ncbi:oligo-1,6-glucosidase [Halogranum gelatinilyticum]|uniref:Oligo-1,6-glucosidase n=1 Tax=Halogranum gelatinilyticum TaxID=660521 RepID=A0A1G9PR31_9EURY|nr:alpha-glucosidase [Halogranum gelatinilyticum]SDM01210.1 oligo-1,6-glucosidase [Halogranum gelatinilyticum]
MSQPAPLEQVDKSWWKEAVVYQIYPRSFNDSNGDGVGDIPGITEKVDYLDELGVDVVWLCPVYDSPNADNGYDIRDYRAIMDEFGTMADWEELLDALHARDMRLIMDLVVNHTSKEHEWFQRSRQRDGKYEDYYYWRDGSPDEPPNNWESIFGGPAWSYDDDREQWYLHLFDENQPDLNWRNPDVRKDVKEMITWWLEKGIDGFRMDAINFISKPEGLPDGDPDAQLVGHEHYAHGPHIHEYLQEVYDDTLANYDTMTVGEMGGTSIEQTAEYLIEGNSGLDMIFQFNHLAVDDGPNGPWSLDGWGEWNLTDLKEIVTRAQDELAAEFWESLFLGNHDLPRIVSRFGDDEVYHEESAKLIATFLLTLRGTPYIYQGEELGMTNVEFDTLDELDDVMTIGKVKELIEAGEIDSFEEVRDLVNYLSRDHARTPMQWSNDFHAGFTEGEPWFDVNENYRDINVEAALADENSIWRHYQSLITLRHEMDTLVYGEYELLLPDHEQLYAYTRTLGDEEVLVVLNWSDAPTTFDAADIETSEAEILLSNYEESPQNPHQQEFRPYEAVLYRL